VDGALFGLGLGLVYASLTSVIVQSVAAEQTGAASGMNTNIRTIGGAVGTAMFSSIITGTAQSGGLPAESGYTEGFLVIAVVAVVAAVVALLVPGARRKELAPVY
jgi:hypothetical protein